MSATLSDILETLDNINKGVEEVTVHNNDLNAVKFVLNESGYNYVERPTTQGYTMIKIDTK